MTLVGGHPAPPSLGWLGFLGRMLSTASLSSAEDPASVSRQQQSTEQHTAFYYFLPFLFVLLIVSKAVIAKSHKLGVLKQQRCIVSQLRRPEKQNQDVSRAGSSLGTQRENRFQAPLLASGGCCRSLACGSLTSLPPSVRGSRPVCVCVFTELSSLSVCPRAHMSLIS